jgi:hypothetical protein
MMLLQQQLTLTKEGMYITAISALVSVIVFLAIWIRKMYNHAIKRSEEDKKELLSVIKENTQINSEMKAAIQMNTLASTNGAEQTSRSMDRLSDAVENLNRDVLKRGGDK